jgi:hypothetical protein
MNDIPPADAPDGAAAALHIDPETGEVLAEAPADDADLPAFILRASESLERGTLAGDVRDAMLEWVKALRKPYAQMSESEQRTVIASLDMAARRLVRGAVRVVAAEDHPFVEIALGQASVEVTKDGKIIKGKFGAAFTPDNHVFFGENTGARVVIVGVSAADYQGERAPAVPDPDQPDLPIAEERPTAREIAPEADAPEMEQDGDGEEPEQGDAFENDPDWSPFPAAAETAEEKPSWMPLREGEEPRPRPGVPYEEAGVVPPPDFASEAPAYTPSRKRKAG